MEVAFRMHEVRWEQHQFMAAQWQMAATVGHANHAVLRLADLGEVGRETLPHPRDHQRCLGAGHPAVQRGNDVRVCVGRDQVRQFVGRKVLGHPHEQLIERQIAARVDDGPGVIVHDQELVGLYRLTILFDEIGEHETCMILVTIEFDGHGSA